MARRIKLTLAYDGRPFEGWSYDRIMAQLGEINYYVNDRLKVPLVVDVGSGPTWFDAKV